MGYYSYPSVRKPEWDWHIPTYFFTGGVASGAHLAATWVDLFGTKEDRPVARAGHLIALALVALSPILLILDLGRPRRFAHMLRIFKTRSPMNLGTWGLSAFGLFTALGVLRLAVEEGLVGKHSLLARLLAWAPLRAYGILGSLFAFFVGSYTGLLLSFTNVPIWARNHLLQGPLFVASAMSTGLAAISFVLAASGTGNRRTDDFLHRAESISNLGEIALTAGSLATLGSLAKPLMSGSCGALFWGGAVSMGMVGPLLLRGVATRSKGSGHRRLHLLASIAALVGGFLFRWVEVGVGQRQADENPEAYFQYTRSHR